MASDHEAALEEEVALRQRYGRPVRASLGGGMPGQVAGDDRSCLDPLLLESPHHILARRGSTRPQAKRERHPGMLAGCSSRCGVGMEEFASDELEPRDV